MSTNVSHSDEEYAAFFEALRARKHSESHKLHNVLPVVSSSSRDQKDPHKGEVAEPRSLHCATSATPSLLRVLAVIRKHEAHLDFRQLALRAGICVKAAVDAVRLAEDEELLLVTRGNSRFNDDPAEANAYRLTDKGQRAIPAALLSASGPYALSEPQWAERRGYGLRGLLLAITFEGPGSCTVEEAATLWECSDRGARDTLYRWAKKQGPLVLHKDGRWHLLPVWASVEQEARSEARERFISLERESARRRQSVAHIRNVVEPMQRQTLQAFEGWDSGF